MNRRDFLTTATATVSGIPATVNNVSATTMEITIPTGATSGNIEVTDDLGCPASKPCHESAGRPCQ